MPLFSMMRMLGQIESDLGVALELTSGDCRKANISFIVTCVSVLVACVLVAVLLKWYLDRRLKLSYTGRVVLPGVLAFILSAGVLAWNPFKSDLLLDCLEHEEYRHLILMWNVTSIPRGIIGGVSAVLLYVIVLVVWGLIAKLTRK